jgi:hypothetical protein
MQFMPPSGPLAKTLLEVGRLPNEISGRAYQRLLAKRIFFFLVFSRDWLCLFAFWEIMPLFGLLN